MYAGFDENDEPTASKLLNIIWLNHSALNETLVLNVIVPGTLVKDIRDSVCPIPVGRLCMSEETTDSIRIRERCGNLTEYMSSLETTCQQGSSVGVLEWTPDENTPDEVFYQVQDRY